MWALRPGYKGPPSMWYRESCVVGTSARAQGMSYLESCDVGTSFGAPGYEGV